jgi:surface carbohydrate biosynthesis protein
MIYFKKFVRKINYFFNIYITPRKVWTKPKKSDVLIFDACGSELLVPFLQAYRVEICSTRGEEVNIPCLARAIFDLDWWRGNIHSAYLDWYIKYSSPKIVITFIDNNLLFYKISNKYKKVKTIFVQNGMRGGDGDIFSRITKNPDYHVDYMLVFGRAFGKKYNQFVSGKYISIGSVKNNRYEKNMKINRNRKLIFISQFRPAPANCEKMFDDKFGAPVSWEQFYKAEELVLNFLSQWCNQEKYLLQILGCQISQNKLEYEFYRKRVSTRNWEFLYRSHLFQSYELVNNAEITVFIDSAMGFESLARGIKCVALSCRGTLLNDNTLNFGWPLLLPDKGEFWTNSCEFDELKRVMDYAHSVSDDEWHENFDHARFNEIIEYDFNNSRLKTLLSDILNK